MAEHPAPFEGDSGHRRLRIAVATLGRFHMLDLARELAALGHEVETLHPDNAGGAQLILREGAGYLAGSDRRKDGGAAGW